MTQSLKYGDDSLALRLEYPTDWDTATGVDLRILNRSGGELLAADACTLYTATTTAATASRGDNTLTLHAGASALSPGDRVEIAASAAGPKEVVTVDHYVATTKIATLTQQLLFNHTSGTAVSGRFCTYDADLSDTDVFPLGKLLTLEWTPDTDNEAFPTTAKIAAHKWEPTDIEGRFATLWPDVYAVMVARKSFAAALKEGRIQLAAWIESKGRNLDRLIDADKADQPLMSLMAWMAVRSEGDSMKYEKESAKEAFDTDLRLLTETPSWWDEDINLTQSEDETAPAVIRYGTLGGRVF